MTIKKELAINVTAVDNVSGPVARAMAVVASQLDKVKMAMKPVGAVFDATFGRAMSGAQKVFNALTSIKTAVIAVGAAVIANRFVDWVTESVSALDEFGERARQLAVTPEWLSQAEYAAKLANVEFAELGDALRKGMENLQAGLDDRSGAVGLLDKLGINAQDAVGQLRPLNELVGDMQEKLADATQGERLAAFKDVFGKSGQAIERLTAGGQLAKYAAQLDALGGTITGSQVAAANRIDDAMDKVGFAWRGIKNQMVELVAEPMEAALNTLSGLLARIPDTIRGAGTLLTTWLKNSDNPMGDAAGKELMKLISAAGELLWQSITSAFTVGWATVVDGAAVLLAWIGPKLGDMLQYAAAKSVPWLVNKPQGYDYFEKLDQLSAARTAERIGRAGGAVSISGVPDLTTGIAEVQTLTGDAARQYAGNTIHPMIQSLEADLAKLAPAVRESEKERTAVMAALLKEGVKEVSDVARDEWAKVLDKSGALGKIVAIAADYGKFVGPLPAAPWVSPFGNGAQLSAFPGMNGPLPSRIQANAADFGPTGAMFEEQTKLRAMLETLNDRLLRATGQDASADRSKLLREQADQVRQLEDLGVAGMEYAGTLEHVQRVELLRFDTLAKLSPLMKQADEAQQAYNDAVAQYQLMADEGVINKGLLKADTVNAAQVLAEKLAGIKDAMAAVAAAAPELGSEFSGELDKVGRSAEEAARKVRRLVGDEQRTFLDGVSSGWMKWGDSIQTAAQLGEESVTRLAGGMSNALGDAFVDAVTGARSFEDAMRSMASSVLKDISQMISRWLAMKAVMGIADAFGGGGSSAAGAFSGTGAQGIGLASSGGWVGGSKVMRLAGGGWLGDARDRIPAMLEPGEAVINKYAVARNGGRGWAERANRGEAGGGGGFVFAPIVNISSPVSRPEAERVGRDLVATFIGELQKSWVARGQMKEVLG